MAERSSGDSFNDALRRADEAMRELRELQTNSLINKARMLESLARLEDSLNYRARMLGFPPVELVSTYERELRRYEKVSS
jgi:hypothetical protein